MRDEPTRRLGLLTVVLGCALAACSRDHVAVNQPPHVEILGSPLEGDSVNYVVDFQWQGRDDDGAVERFEYAVDVPSTFTPDQIADPATVGIEWISTTSIAARLHFRVGQADSASVASGLYSTTSPAAPHSFFIRAFDDEGAHSAVAVRSFNAWTLLPQTTITYPAGGAGRLVVGHCFVVRWTGLDPDGSPPNHRPERTEYKLIPISSILGARDENYIVNVDPGPSYPWARVPGDSGTATVIVKALQSYLFALRSIDEAGGVESRFETGRNALLIASGAPFPGSPTLTIHERLLGNIAFPRDGTQINCDIIAGQCLNFDMTGDGESYGGLITAYRWCVDAEESPLEGGAIAGCVPWGTTRVVPPICFTTPGIHTVAFAARDRATECGGGGSYVGGLYSINVLPRYFRREVLYVDDYYDPPGDAESDRRFVEALHDAGFHTVDSYSAWGEGDLNGAVISPSLGLLSRYGLVFWSVRGAGGGTQNGRTALLESSACAVHRTLQTYVAAGGAIWINGDVVFGALKDRNGAIPGSLCVASGVSSPETGLNFSAGEFVTDFLHINGGDLRNAKDFSATHGLVRARPTAAALRENFPTLEADSTFTYASLGGVPFYDAQFLPAFLVEGGLDTLYVAETAGHGSAFNGKPIAWRYADPNPVPRQGPVAVTSFPLHKMREGSVSHVVDGLRISGTGLKGLVEVMRAWFQAHDATGTGS